MHSIVLQPFTESDCQRLISWIDSPELCFLWTANSFSYPISQTALVEHLNGAIRSIPQRAIFKAVATQDSEVVGHIELDRIDWEHRTAAICRIIVDPKRQGEGLGSEMLRALFIEAFSNLGLEELTLNVFDDSLRAIKVYERAGLIRTGTKKAFARYQNSDRDVICMKISKQAKLESQIDKDPQGQIDRSLVEHSLTLSYEERIDAHESALQLVRELQKAGQEFYARQSKSPA